MHENSVNCIENYIFYVQAFFLHDFFQDILIKKKNIFFWNNKLTNLKKLTESDLNY